MQKNKPLLFSLSLSLLIVLATFLLSVAQLTIRMNFLYALLLLVTVFIITYTGTRHLCKESVTQILKNTPSLHTLWQNDQNPEILSREIHNITQETKEELDVFYERENYRREFIGNVAHELKTPLFSIQGYLLTLIEGGVDDENIRDKYLNRINKSVERLSYIVKDLDLITELESGNFKLEIYPFNIVALVQEVFEILEIKAEKNKITLSFDRVYDEPIKVLADIEKIEQVLMNLIVNAINHAQRDCGVTVSFTPMREKVRVTISDTGMGIKPEDLTRIFERFYRADKSRSRIQGGSGLGLAIVKHILEAHQEKIQVESTYGEGSSFSFTLNRA